MKNLKIKTRLLIGFILPVVFIIITLIWGVLSTKNIIDSVRHMNAESRVTFCLRPLLRAEKQRWKL